MTVIIEHIKDEIRRLSPDEARTLFRDLRRGLAFPDHGQAREVRSADASCEGEIGARYQEAHDEAVILLGSEESDRRSEKVFERLRSLRPNLHGAGQSPIKTGWCIHPSAQQEHDLLLDLMDTVSSGAMSSFEVLYRKHLRWICQDPSRYTRHSGPVRFVSLEHGFSDFYIAYAILRDKLVILMVGSCRLRPYCWEKRDTDFRLLSW